MDALTLDDVAARLQKAPQTLRRLLPKLMRDHNFPRTLPGLGLRWSAVAVDHWIATGGAVLEAANDDSYLNRWRTHMNSRQI